MPEEQQPESRADLRELLWTVRRRLGVILLCTVLVAGAALAFSLLAQKEYTAKASLLFRDPQLDQKLFGSSFVAQNQDDARQAATNLQLVSLDVVAAKTAGELGRGFTASDVKGKVEATQQGQADVISIAATDQNARLAARIANTFAREYIAFRRDADRAKVA